MRSILISITVLCISGCAIHSPMSEMLMFQDKEDLDGKPYKARYSHSLGSFTANLYYPELVNKYTEKHYPTGEELQYDYSTAKNFTTNAIIMSDKTDKIAVSLAFGTSMGVDGTIKVFNNTYLTGVVGLVYDQGQIIIQRRIIDDPQFGLSLGATYLRNNQYVTIQGVRCGLCFPSREFFTNSIGIRSVALLNSLSSYGKSAFFFYMMGSINYDLTMNIVYPRIGFSMGIY